MDFVFSYSTLGLNSVYSGKIEYWSCMLLYSQFYYLRAGCYIVLFWQCIKQIKIVLRKKLRAD